MVVLFLPSVHIIEKYGLNKATVLGMGFTSIGVWVAESGYYTMSIFLISLGGPFIINSGTKVASAWYGPKGRSIATTVIVMFMYLAPTLNEFLEDKIRDGLLAFCIVVTAITPIIGLLIYDKPDFSPTMSEEDKLDK